MTNTSNKPPLGLMPEWRHKELRLQEIREAVQRYLDAKQPVPINWIVEEYCLREWLENREEEKKSSPELIQDPIVEEKEFEGKEFGNPFEKIVYWATHSGWRYCQGKPMCGNEVILKLSHFKSMVKQILKEEKTEQPFQWTEKIIVEMLMLWPIMKDIDESIISNSLNDFAQSKSQTPSTPTQATDSIYDGSRTKHFVHDEPGQYVTPNPRETFENNKKLLSTQPDKERIEIAHYKYSTGYSMLSLPPFISDEKMTAIKQAIEQVLNDEPEIKNG